MCHQNDRFEIAGSRELDHPVDVTVECRRRWKMRGEPEPREIRRDDPRLALQGVDLWIPLTGAEGAVVKEENQRSLAVIEDVRAGGR